MYFEYIGTYLKLDLRRKMGTVDCQKTWINSILIHQLSDIGTGRNVFPQNIGKDTKIMPFDWLVSELWQLIDLTANLDAMFDFGGR
jgi:hypothetical protein